MKQIRSHDGTMLYVDDQGAGEPIIFAHEFGGDHRSWDGQFAEFSSSYRCIRFSARGFLPSDVPEPGDSYGQDQSTRDLFSVVDALGLERFHLAGLSMGSFTSLMAAMSAPARLLSLTLMGCSSGPCTVAERERYRQDLTREIAQLEASGGDGAVRWFAEDSAYARVATKHPTSWETYCEHLRGQSVIGAIRTLKTLHWNRVCLRDRAEQIRAVDVPTLLIYGDEDHHFIEPTNDFLAVTLPRARFVKIPGTGHLVNIEEPEILNKALRENLTSARAPFGAV